MWLGVIVIILVVCVLLILATQETCKGLPELSKSYQKITPLNFKKGLMNACKNLENQEGDTIVFGGMYRVNKYELEEFIKNDFNGWVDVVEHKAGIFGEAYRGFTVNSINEYCNYFKYQFLFVNLDNYRLEKSEYWYWSKFVDANETYERDSWYKIDNGEYYTNNGIVYRFKEWMEVGSFEDWFINNRDNLKGRIELCKDPREEHWEHFLDLEIKAKKDRLQQCKEWVDTVLKKQQKYNDICLINEVATTPLIHDYETLKNFCNMSGEKVKFEEYEITNYLLIIRNTLTKV